MRRIPIVVAGLICGTLWGAPAPAEEAASGGTAAAADPALAALLAKEKEDRRACKIEICSIMLGKHPEGDDVACEIVKTWPKDDITKLIKRAKVEWPWGNTTCRVEVKLKRSMLVSAMTEPKFEAAFDEHVLACDVLREGEDAYEFKISMTPNITFENGKATGAHITWGALEAPSVAKSVLWSATALDNQLNVLGGELIETVNGFVEKKCAEVGDELKLN
jgi:hypothetical protein